MAVTSPTVGPTADPPAFNLVARTGHPVFIDFPWDRPLSEWDDDRLVDYAKGVSRHVVRFVAAEGRAYALKETSLDLARREYRLLRWLAEENLPAVEGVGVVSERRTRTGKALPAVLITRHLEFSLPYRVLFAGRGVPDVRSRLIDALAVLLVRLHLAGFFWGDCSLSNVLFRRDAGALLAYLVDAETGEQRPDVLSDGQRRHDLVIATENVAGELLDLGAAKRLPSDVDPLETADDLERRYTDLWAELTTPEVIPRGERNRLEARTRRLNELGFDVEEYEVSPAGDGDEVRMWPGCWRRATTAAGCRADRPAGAGEPGPAPPQRHRRLRRVAGADARAASSPRRWWPTGGCRRSTSRRSTGCPSSCGGSWPTPSCSTRSSSTAGTCPSSGASTSTPWPPSTTTWPWS